MKSLFLSLLVSLSVSTGFCQKASLNWFLKSKSCSSVYGTGADKAYTLLKDKTAKEVVVAVIDSGVEVDHEDLKDMIWVNPNEIPGNNMDDDKNGYVDDIHGWSFLGGKTLDVNYETSELARIVMASEIYFKGKEIATLNNADQLKYEDFKLKKEEYLKSIQNARSELEQLNVLYGYIVNVKNEFKVYSKKTNKKYVPKNNNEVKSQKLLKFFNLMIGASAIEKEIMNGFERANQAIRLSVLDNDSLRNAIVGDNPNDLYERFYGCNRYEGPDAMHGTHVSGIIAAKRNNGIGINGIAANAKIMVLRAVPNGDERDKDVANAIYYAVDNGAKVINMSFGKDYCTTKEVVDKAIAYAKSKDVLLVHAAGNASKNVDSIDFFPNKRLTNGTIASNWIEIGASSSSRKGKKLIGDFSNYGAKNVDIFAPGVDIYSTVPNNSFEDASGTSMASPVTAGVAALLRGYFPELSAEEIIEAIKISSVKSKKIVRIPGTKKKTTLINLSNTGGFVSAEKAVQYLLKKEIKPNVIIK